MSPPSRNRLLAYGALAVAVLGISWSTIFVRWAAVPGPTSAFDRALLAVPLLGEPLHVTQAVGGALVLAGIYIVNRGGT